MTLPDRVFFTGVPGSRWSGIAQTLEQLSGFNTSDRTVDREYTHSNFSGHKGAYFGRLMEFDAVLDAAYIDQAWSSITGTRLVKSHDWAYCLDQINLQFPDDWIILVYRDDATSFQWWKEAGGFDIQYPSYQSYVNDDIMQREISWQNQSIKEFSQAYQLQWSPFNSEWISDTFAQTLQVPATWNDIQITILKK